MKRIFAGIGISLLCFSTGCTVMQSIQGKTVNTMAEGFISEVVIQNTDMESRAELTRYGTDAWQIVFSEPQNLAGVKLEFIDDEVKASYKGLEFSVPQSAQAIRTELEQLMEIVDQMSLNSELTGKTEDGKIICEGSIEEGNYTLIFNDSGIPEEFSLPCYDLQVKFENFTPQNQAIPETETTIPEVSETAEEAVIPETIPAKQAAAIAAE